MDSMLKLSALNECWVRFLDVSFGVALAECWPELRRSLLEVEHCLAAGQHNVSYVGQYLFNPAVLTSAKVLPRPFPYDPDKQAWLRCEM